MAGVNITLEQLVDFCRRNGLDGDIKLCVAIKGKKLLEVDKFRMYFGPEHLVLEVNEWSLKEVPIHNPNQIGRTTP